MLWMAAPPPPIANVATSLLERHASPMAETLAESVRELVAELEARFPYAAALLTGATGTQITDDGREQSASEVDPSRGIVFTVYDGSAFAEYSTSDLTPEHLAAGVRGWAGELSPRPSGPPLASERDAPPTTAEPRVFGVAMEVDPAAVPLQDKLVLLRDVQQRAQALDTRIVQARIGYTDNTYESTYIGRGRFLDQHVTRTRLFLVIAVSDGGQVRYDYLNRGGTVGFELTRISDGDLARTVETAVRLLTAERIEPGEYDIVADNAISGVIAHESFGHGVELDLYPKGRARSAHYLDQQVAAAGLNMYDDPSVAGGYGSYFFDDEGELARSTQILRDGVFVRAIIDFPSSSFRAGLQTADGQLADIPGTGCTC